MARRARDHDIRAGGASIGTRFALMMTLVTIPILALGGLFIHKSVIQITEASGQDVIHSIARMNGQKISYERRGLELEAIVEMLTHEQRMREVANRRGGAGEDEPVVGKLNELLETYTAQLETERRNPPFIRSTGTTQINHDEVGLIEQSATFGSRSATEGRQFKYRDGSDAQTVSILAPADETGGGAGDLFKLIIGLTLLVTLAVAGMAVWVGGQVSRPIGDIIHDIRQISAGNLRHRIRVTGGGEVAVLAKAVDRMTKSLVEAQDTELELEVRDREVEVAAEVRDALMTESVPGVLGFELAAVHLESSEMGGDFLDFIEHADGSVGMLVCDVSGRGVPGALVGATARAYLRSALLREPDVEKCFVEVNRELARHMRRGMFVTALYVLVHPNQTSAEVVCAGHKIPLIRFTADDGQVRLIQPEGIALGFDRGPIFQRALEIQNIALEPGDRLVLANTGAVAVPNDEGEEFGEKALYSMVMRHGARDSDDFLERMQTVLESYAGENALPQDITMITIARAAQ